MGVELDDIFDSFTKNSIFQDKHVLQANYNPETIPHRDDQIKQIAAILAPTLRLDKPSNLFIYGKTGTGKTLSVQYVCNQLEKRAKQNKANLKFFYINCKLKKVADTEYRILAELLRQLGKQVPSTGLPTDQIYHRFIQTIDDSKKLIVIVLDEVDQAVKKIEDNFLYNLTRLNSELKNSQLTIIGISNDLVFLDNVDPRVKSSLSEEEIVFPPYNALQIQDILRERAKLAFKEKAIGDGVIEKCSAYAAREHGDARRALDLLRIAGELTEREGKKEVNINYIDSAKQKIEKDKIIDIISTQPKQFQLVLLAIMALTDSRKNEKIFTGDTFNSYRDFCEQTGTEPLTQRRVGDILSEFDMLGIINAQVVSKGRHGRTKEIKLSIPPHLINKSKIIVRDSLGLK
ncbi:ORC1-type DNA replication protein [Nanoarchaeota archaeon]